MVPIHDAVAQDEHFQQKMLTQTDSALLGASSDDDNSGPTRSTRAPSSDLTTPLLVSATPETTPLLYPQLAHAPEQWAQAGMMGQTAGVDCFMLPDHCYMPAAEDWWTPAGVPVDNGAFEYYYGQHFHYGHLTPEDQKQMEQAMCGDSATGMVPPTAYDCSLMPIPEHNPSLAAAGMATEVASKQVVGLGKETRTTVMMRNLPETFTRTTLLDLLSAEGFFGRFDFIYVPFDFKRHFNLGYALINMVSPSEAQRFSKHFDGFEKWKSSSDLPCVVVWSNPHQGLSTHVERYRNSPVMHESVPEQWRPMLFKHGVAVPFPEPTKKIKAPKVKAAP